MSKENLLERLLWIELPSNIDRDMGTFTLDPSIPLPIESEENEVCIDDISWDDISTSILLLLADYPSCEHSEYYRALILALQPNIDANLEEMAWNCIEEENWEKAMDISLALRGLKPESWVSKHLMAKNYDRRAALAEQMGQSEIASLHGQAAETAYQELLIDEEVAPQAIFDAGMFQYRQKNFKSALQNLERYLHESPDGIHADEAKRIVQDYLRKGQADDLYVEAYRALQENRIEEGIGLAEELSRKEPNSWPAYFLLGWAYRISENWYSAREALETAESRGYHEPDIYKELAKCYHALEELQMAVVTLKKALHREPNNIKIIFNIAYLLIEQGDKEEAIRWLETAITLSPDDEQSKKLLKEIV